MPLELPLLVVQAFRHMPAEWDSVSVRLVIPVFYTSIAARCSYTVNHGTDDNNLKVASLLEPTSASQRIAYS
jgi:hypothetical protein